MEGAYDDRDEERVGDSDAERIAYMWGNPALLKLVEDLNACRRFVEGSCKKCSLRHLDLETLEMMVRRDERVREQAVAELQLKQEFRNTIEERATGQGEEVPVVRPAHVESNRLSNLEQGRIVETPIARRMFDDDETEEEEITVQHRPDLSGWVGPRVFDSDKFMRYGEIGDGRPLSLREKARLEIRNLRMIGICQEENSLRIPEYGIPVSKDSYQRLSYISYSTLDLQTSALQGGIAGTDHANVRELDVVKYPPKLTGREYEDIRVFCRKRDQYLADLAKIFSSKGKIYQPINLVSSVHPRIRSWLAVLFAVPLSALSPIHVDAMLIAVNQFDPLDIDADKKVPDLIKSLRVRFSRGETLQTYVMDVVGQVTHVVSKNSLLRLINKNTTLSKECVQAVCSLLPKPYNDRIYKRYEYLTMDKKNNMYKNFQGFLEHLIDTTGGDIPLTKDMFRKEAKLSYDHKKGQTNVFAIKAQTYDSVLDSASDGNADPVVLAFQQALNKEKEVCWGCQKDGHRLRDCSKVKSLSERKKIAEEKLATLKRRTKRYFNQKYEQGFNKREEQQVEKIALAEICAIVGKTTREETDKSETDSSEEDENENNKEGCKDGFSEGEGESSDDDSDGHELHNYRPYIGRNETAGRKDKKDANSTNRGSNVNENSKKSKEQKEKDKDEWDASELLKEMSEKRKAIIFPTHERETGLTVSIKAKYLGDSG